LLKMPPIVRNANRRNRYNPTVPKIDKLKTLGDWVKRTFDAYLNSESIPRSSSSSKLFSFPSLPGSFPSEDSPFHSYLARKYFKIWKINTIKRKKHIAKAVEVYEFNRKASCFLLWMEMSKKRRYLKKILLRQSSFSAREEDLPPYKILKEKPGAPHRIRIHQKLCFANPLEDIFTYDPDDDQINYVSIVPDDVIIFDECEVDEKMVNKIADFYELKYLRYAQNHKVWDACYNLYKYGFRAQDPVIRRYLLRLI
ncbi:5393_t:CDS:2, partial [Dentiscutata heterogama]